jgi:hypothetical protein
MKGPTFFTTKKWPDVGQAVLVWDSMDNGHEYHDFDPCGAIAHPEPGEKPPPMKVPMPGNQDKRKQDKKKEREDD